ncbi:hypothetical protein [Nonlabens xiamenensis]|uniref:hypothetical protein n=1 Tax=Nonlabens xiamenensis TaxID=2341043 RepID=UPI000F61380E|nr:hypothetical protein [Nonlabens xiamenensis]
MKNISKFLFAFLAIALIGCEEDLVIYDNVNGPALVAFSNSSFDLEIEIDATGSVTVPVNVSTISDMDRTFNIEVSQDPEENTLVDMSVMIPSTVTIPANSYTGEVVITGQDVPGVDTAVETVVLRIEDGAGFSVGQPTTINVFQVCPIPADYMVGDYSLFNLSGVVGPGNGTENFESGTVTLSVGSSPSQRVFSAAIYPGFRPTAVNNTINLVCGNLVLGQTGPSPALGCTATPLLFGPATNQTTYDLSDDTNIIVAYNEDIDGSCGGPFANQAILLQKL